MRRLFVCFGLLAGLSVLWPSAAAGQNQKKGSPKLEQATDADYAYLRKMKEIAGILTAFDPESNTLTLRVEYKTAEPIPLKPNPRMNQQYNNLVRQQQRLMQDYQNIMNSRNPRQQQQRMAQFQRDYARLQQQFQQMGFAQQPQFKVVRHTKEFDFDVAPEPKVARAKPPMEYDDKGNVKEYTKEELKKMRDPDMPGYTAKADDLQAGQTVKLYLGKPKAKKSTASPQKEPDDTEKPAADTKTPAGKKSDSKGTDEKTGPEHAYVRQILILADADPDFRSTPQDNRKGKKQ